MASPAHTLVTAFLPTVVFSALHEKMAIVFLRQLPGKTMLNPLI
jgi:hypothetical protein